MQAALQSMLTETVTVRHYVSQDAYGKPTYGSPQTYAVREEFGIRKVVDATGADRVSRTRLFFDNNVTLDLRDQITLSDGTTPPILEVKPVHAANGPLHHYEVRL